MRHVSFIFRRAWIIITGPGILNAILLVILAIFRRQNQQVLPSAPQEQNESPQRNNQAKNESLVTSMAIAVTLAVFFLGVIAPVSVFNFKLVQNQPLTLGLSYFLAFLSMPFLVPALFLIVHKNAVKHVVSLFKK